MTKIVSCAGDDFAGFAIDGPPAWAGPRNLPIDLGAERRLAVLEESSGLPFADFMSVSGIGYAHYTTFAASDAAWVSLLEGRFGIAAQSDVACPDGYRVVIVAGKLDVIDFDRSVEMFPGYYEGLHVHDVADELAGASLFSAVGDWRLLCGDQWADQYVALGLTGLLFEPAVLAY